MLEDENVKQFQRTWMPYENSNKVNVTESKYLYWLITHSRKTLETVVWAKYSAISTSQIGEREDCLGKGIIAKVHYESSGWEEDKGIQRNKERLKGTVD